MEHGVHKKIYYTFRKDFMNRLVLTAYLTLLCTLAHAEYQTPPKSLPALTLNLTIQCIVTITNMIPTSISTFKAIALVIMGLEKYPLREFSMLEASQCQSEGITPQTPAPFNLYP